MKAKKSGSAETGGEKAAPSPLSRINFFGTRGHEGGVEAYLERTSDTTFALRTGRGYLLMSDIPASVADSLTWPKDPGADSREPEKLNNAQKFDEDTVSMQDVALAESSLSSPPPNGEDKCAQCPHARDRHSWRGTVCIGSCVLCSCRGFVESAASPELLPTQLPKDREEK